MPSDACRVSTSAVAVDFDPRLHLAAFVVAAPGPRVAKPERRQQMKRRRVRPAIGDRDAHEHIIGRCFGVFGHDVEVAVLVEDAGVGELKFRFAFAAAAVLLDEPGIGKLALRILVERLHVRMGRRRVEIVVTLLDVLAVVAFRAGQAEQPLFENRIAAVPKCQSEAEPALAIGEAEQPVLAPAVGAAASLVVREVIPTVAVLRIVLADRSPLPLRTGTIPTAANWPCARGPRASRCSSAVGSHSSLGCRIRRRASRGGYDWRAVADIIGLLQG